MSLLPSDRTAEITLSVPGRASLAAGQRDSWVTRSPEVGPCLTSPNGDVDDDTQVLVGGLPMLIMNVQLGEEPRDHLPRGSFLIRKKTEPPMTDRRQTSNRCASCDGRPMLITPMGYLCSECALDAMELDDGWVPLLRRGSSQ